MEHKKSRAEELEEKRIFWKQHIDRWQETGVSQTEYCRRHNLKHHQLAYWKKRFLPTEPAVSFVPLKLEDLLDAVTGPESASLWLTINNYLKVEIRAGFNPQLLRQVILAVRGLP